ncbi:MAG: sugar ABC transporter permease [Clostridia bacterium]|nr:sugar ABC transporter permease [Clostridia bacterium]
MKNTAKSASLKQANRNRRLSLVVFLGPFLVTFFLFTILPVLVSIMFSLTNFNLLEMPDFVGLDNYAKLFLNDSVFSTAIQNTLIIACITGPIGYLLCFAFAWLVNEIPPKPRAFMTLLFFAPSLSGGMSAVWALLFSSDSYGYINAWLQEFDIISEPIRWTVDTDYMFPVCIIIILWQSLGTTFLTFIAGLQTVDRSLYEAGAVDGIKNRWQELYYITLPQMRGQLMFGAILAITGSFGVDGIITAVFGFPTQSYKLHTIMHHLHDYGNVRYEMGYACAIAALLFLISILANKVVQFVLDRIGK